MATPKNSPNAEPLSPEKLAAALFDAITKNNTGRLESLLREGVDPNYVRKSGHTPLVLASEKGRHECIDILGRYGADPNLAMAKTARTPLIAALEADLDGDTAVTCMEKLLGLGAEIHPRDRTGLSALHHAAVNGNIAALDRLEQAGANLYSVAENGWTVLHFAADNGRIPLIEHLLAKGMNLNHETSDERTVLSVAAKAHPETVRYLLGQGARVAVKTSGGMTPLHFAAGQGKPESVRLLIEAGAIVNAKGASGLTPLHAACAGMHDASALVLLEAGADVNARTSGSSPNWDLATPLHLLFDRFNFQKYDSARFDPLICALLDAGADSEALDAKGRPPLEVIDYRGAQDRKELIATLIERHRLCAAIGTSAAGDDECDSQTMGM